MKAYKIAAQIDGMLGRSNVGMSLMAFRFLLKSRLLGNCRTLACLKRYLDMICGRRVTSADGFY